MVFCNSSYRVTVKGEGQVVVRIAPEPLLQSRLEHGLMRNEHASVPYLAPVAELMPETIAADFTHDLLNRDYLVQSHLAGVPASDGLAAYPRDQQSSFWTDLGQILARIHSVAGTEFGRVQGPLASSWSAAVEKTLADMVADMDDAGLEAGDVRQVSALVTQRRQVLDEISQPSLLHGDLWIGNVMLAADTPTPRISGIFDCDRTSWGDPMADWTMFMIGRRSPNEVAAFWLGYGERPEESEGARVRSLIYQARNLGESRLEYHRLHESARIPANYGAMAELITELGEY